MRKSLWIVLAVLFVVVAPVAHADSYAVTFTCDGCAVQMPPIVPPTAPDVTFPSPSFAVTFEGFVFDLPAFPSNFLPEDTYVWAVDLTMCEGGVCIADLGIKDTDIAFDNFVSAQVSTGSTQLPNFGGKVILTPVSAPEPSSVALMLLGVGLLFVMRKRIGQGLPQAS